MTVWGPQSIHEGCQIQLLLFLNVCTRAAKGKSQESEMVAWGEVCLQGVGSSRFIDWSTAAIFPLKSVAEMFPSNPGHNPTAHVPTPAPDTPSTTTNHSTAMTQVVQPKFRGHLLPDGGRLSFVVCNGGRGGLRVRAGCAVWPLWHVIWNRTGFMLGWQTMATRTSKTSLPFAAYEKRRVIVLDSRVDLTPVEL